MGRPHKPGYFSSRNCWRFMLDGKRKYFCKGVLPDSRPQREGIPRAVWDEMDRIIRAASEPKAGTDRLTVFWLVQKFLKWVETEVGEGRMVAKQHQNATLHLAHFLELSGKGDGLAAMLSPDDVDDFFSRFAAIRLKRTSRPPGAHYTHNIGKTIRSMYKWGCRPVKGRSPTRLLSSNPLEGYKFPAQPGAVRGYVEGDTIRRFLRWCWAKARWAHMDRRSSSSELALLKPPDSTVKSLKRRFDRIYVLMLHFQRLTGCRPGEACRLEWSEVGEFVITIQPNRVKTRKQTNRARRIWITPPVARILRAIERLPGRHPDFVFPHMRATNSTARGHLDPLAGEPWPSGSAASGKLTGLRDEAVKANLKGLERIGPTNWSLTRIVTALPQRDLAWDSVTNKLPSRWEIHPK